MKRLKILTVIVLAIICMCNISFVKATDELPDNGAKITSAQIIQTKTGTGPFDENDEPGNDSSEDNNIVRSFDQVTWTIENTMAVKGNNATSYTGGKIYVEATVKGSQFTSETFKWDKDSMKWMENATISSDGLTITGCYTLTSTDVTVPGKQNLVLVAKVLGATNGTQLQPTIKTWLNGNTEEDKVTLVPDMITVSAAPSYNVKLIRNGNCANRTTLKVGNQDVTGRVYGYAVVFQLYNSSISKGLKGIEYPTGKISVDLDMSLSKKNANSSQITDITDTVTPLLYNYSLAVNGRKGLIDGKDLYIGRSSFSYYGNNSYPQGILSSDRNSCVYKSGTPILTQNGNKLTLEVDGYEFDGTFPIYNYGYNKTSPNISYTKNIGCFSSIYFQVIVPDWDEYDSTTDYYFKISDNNFKATSLSGNIVVNQAVTSDDASSAYYIKTKPGSYNSLVYVYKRNKDSVGGILHSRWDRGDGKVAKNQTLFLCSTINQSDTNDEENFPRTINDLYKFDADCFEPVVLSNGKKFLSSNTGKMTYKMWYVTKKDGTNWTTQKEMNETDIDGLDFYENLEDIPSNKLCVGVYYESQGGVFHIRDDSIYFPVIVKKTATIGQTYSATQKVTYYTYEIDRTKYTIANEEARTPSYYPTDYVYRTNRNYVKTEYNDDGTQVTGTHAGGTYYGNTVLVIGASQRIQIAAVNEQGSAKTNYDLAKNEYNVRYKLTPILTSSSSDAKIEDVAVQVIANLPKDMSYVSNSSSYGEPEITNNSDGTTTLKWNISGCTVNASIENIYFEAHMNEESSNGKQYDVSATIYADPSKVGVDSVANRTSTTSVQVINLASHRLYKTVETPVVEKNGEIHYKLLYKNNTDTSIPNFQLLDILPYNGDLRGTEFNGTYTLDRLVVTQENESGNKISNDNLEILYTNDESVRNTVTSKDENLGENWTKVTAEDVKSKATALVVKGNVGNQGKVTVDVYLKPQNNQALDKYANSATAQIYKETEQIITSNVEAQVIERKIEGVAWEDTNANGIKDKSEMVLENVEITLTDDQGNQVTDVNGNLVSSVKTDKNGYYKFIDLPKGKYYLKITIPSSKYELTQKGVGNDTQINSKFEVEAKETDEITKLDSADLPQLVVSNVNAGLVKKATKVIVNYKEDGTNTVLHDEVTIDGRIDDNYKTEDKLDEINQANANKYEYVRVEGNTEGTMTQDTIYVTYYYQKKNANVKVLHVLEGTDVSNPEAVTDTLYKAEEITGRVDDSYTTQNRLSEINASSKLQYELVTDNVLNKSGNMALDTIYVVYEYRTIPAVVKVKHLEKDTNVELIDQETQNGLVGNEYTTQDKLEDINKKYDNKYELVLPEPDNKNGEFKKEEQEVIYYYQKKQSSIEVNYVEVGTNKVLAEQVTATGRIDEEYTTENKLDEINKANDNKYEFVKVEGNAEGKYTLEKQVITYYYQKKQSSIEVNYVEVGTNKVLADQVTATGRIDDEYTTENKLDEINKANDNKYEFVKVEGNAEGKYTLEKQIITYYYQKKQSSIEVNYVEVGTNNVLADQVTATGRIDEEYTTENKLDEINKANDNKYEFVKVEGNTEGKYTLEKQVITYYYQKKQSSIEVNYVEVGTNNVLADQVNKTGRIDDEYTTENKLDEINKANDNKYEFVKVEGNAEGKYTLGKQVITYYYQKKQSSIEVNYVEVGTNKVLADQVTATGRIDDEYTTENKLDEINNKNDNKYEFVKVEGNTEGKYTLEKQVITYYYQKKQSSIEVNYVEVGTNKVLADQVTATGRIDDEYTTENKLDEINKINANKYEFVKTTGDATEGVYKLEKQTITYWYQKKATKVVTKYIDINSNEEIYDSYEQEGRIDDKYTTVNELENINKKYNNIYEFVKSTDNTEGNMTKDIIEVVYYYQKKQSNVKVLHVLEGTDVSDPEKVTDTLYDTENIEERIDDDYTTQNRLNEINNSHKEQYDLVSDDVVNKAGKIKLDTIYVIYEYRKAPSKIKIEHKDIDTDEDLVQVETRDGIVGNDYTTENKLDEINTEYDNKYELVLPEPNNKNGEFKREEQTITYYYQKKATNVIVKYVDIDTEEELVDGEELVGKVDDEYSTIDKVEEINENNKNKYVLVKTTENTEGNMTLDTIEVIYYYKKVEAQVIVKQVDEKTGEEIADREYIGGYVGDDYTTSSKEIDGYELVQNKIPENKDGKYEEETIIVTYYYNKIETPQTGDINVAMYIIIALVSLGVISKKVIFKKI